MKIAFYSSTLGDRPLEEVVRFARDAGFDAIEIDIRRHIVTPSALKGAVQLARDHGLDVCSVTLFGNQLDPDPSGREQLRDQTMEFAKAAAGEGVPALVIFPGRSAETDDAADYEDFADFARTLLKSTADTNLNILMENWPGPQGRFIATTPAGWKRLFASVPDRRLGLEFDPSHLIWQGIDPFDALSEMKDRIGILHGKDTRIDPVTLQDTGYAGRGWWRYTLPGRGQLDWAAFLARARHLGFDGVVSIEHEDKDFGWPNGALEQRLTGHREALAHLRGASTS